MTLLQRMTDIGGLVSAIVGGAAIGWFVPTPMFWAVIAVYCAILMTVGTILSRVKILEDRR